MTTRYFHRRLKPDEFTALLKSSPLKMNDFLFFTGRHMAALMAYLGKGTKEEAPTMGDVMLVELCARNPALFDQMMDIANEYALDAPARAERTGSR